jgi:hypothetical protein
LSDIKHQQKFILNKNKNTQWVSTGYNKKRCFKRKIPAGEGDFAFQNAQPYAEKFLWIRWALDTQEIFCRSLPCIESNLYVCVFLLVSFVPLILLSFGLCWI